MDSVVLLATDVTIPLGNSQSIDTGIARTET